MLNVLLTDWLTVPCRFLDNRLFATCSDDTTIALWDLRKLNSKVCSLHGHASWVKNIEYDTNTRLLVTSGFDGNVITWDTNRYVRTYSWLNVNVVIVLTEKKKHEMLYNPIRLFSWKISFSSVHVMLYQELQIKLRPIHDWYFKESLSYICLSNKNFNFSTLKWGKLGFWLHFKPQNLITKQSLCSSRRTVSLLIVLQLRKTLLTTIKSGNPPPSIHVTVFLLQVYRRRLPAQKVLPHPLLNEDATDARLFQDAHLHFLRVPAHPPRPGPHPVPGGGQLPYAASATDAPQLR